MMLTIYGLPNHVKYHDLKVLVKQQCNIGDFILDNLVSDSVKTKRVRIGLADEREGAQLIKCLDGFRMGGQILRVSPAAKTGNSEHQGNIHSPRNDYRPDGPNYNQLEPRPSQSGPLSRPEVMLGRPLPIPSARSGFQSHQESMRGAPSGLSHSIYDPARSFTGPVMRVDPLQSHPDPVKSQTGLSIPGALVGHVGPMNRDPVQPVAGQSRSNVWEQSNQWGIQSQCQPPSSYGYQATQRDNNTFGLQNKPLRQMEPRPHSLRSVEIVAEPLALPIVSSSPARARQPQAPMTICKDNFQGPHFLMDRRDTSYQTQEPWTQNMPQGNMFPNQTQPYEKLGFETKYSDSGPDPKPEMLVSGDYEKGPRFSPRRDVHMQGRRESPGRRPSPGRRISPGPRHSSDSRRVESSPPRRSPRRYDSSPRRDKPSSHDTYRGRPTVKEVRPAYEAPIKAPKQTMHSGDHRQSIHENVAYPVAGHAQEYWQERDIMFGGKTEDDRREMRAKFDQELELKSRQRPGSRSPMRHHPLDRSPPRDRIMKHSMSPRSPRRSWAFEKRRSQEYVPPPPPMWRGPPQDDEYRRNRSEHDDNNHGLVWERSYNDKSDDERRPDTSGKRPKRDIRIRSDLVRPGLPGLTRASSRDQSPCDRPDRLSKDVAFSASRPKFEPRSESNYPQSAGARGPRRDSDFVPLCTTKDSNLEPRRDLKFEPRDVKFEPRDVKFEPRDVKFEPRNVKFESRRDSVFETRESRFESKREHTFEPRDTKFAPRREPTLESKVELRGPKFEPRLETAFEGRHAKFETNRELPFEPRDQKYEPKKDPQFESRDSKFVTRKDRQFGPRDLNFEPRRDRQFEDRDPKYPKFEPRKDSQFMQRDLNFEPRKDSQFEQRDLKFEPRTDCQFESRDLKCEPRKDLRFEPRDLQYEPRKDSRFESRDPKIELRREQQFEPWVQSRGTFEPPKDPKFEPKNTSLEPRRDPKFEPIQPLFEPRDVKDSKFKPSLSRFKQKPLDFETRQDIEIRLAKLKRYNVDREQLRDDIRSDRAPQRDSYLQNTRPEEHDIIPLSKIPKSDFNKEFDDVYKRTLEFKQKVEEMRRSGDKKREESAEKKCDKKLQWDDERRRDLSRKSARPDDRRQDIPEDPKRNRGKDSSETAEMKSKRDKAVEEISQKILHAHGSNLDLSPNQMQRVLEELRVRLVRIFKAMFDNQDVSFIEMVVKFNARFGSKLEAQLFEDAMNVLPSSLRKRPRQEMRGDPAVPPKTARLTSDDNFKKGLASIDETSTVPDWSMNPDPQEVAALMQQFDIAPQMALQDMIGMSTVVPMVPLPMNPAMVSLQQPLLHELPMQTMMPPPCMQQQVIQPIIESPVMPLSAPELNVVKDTSQKTDDKPLEENESGYFNLYLCKDDFEPYSSTQAEYLKNFLVNKIIAASESNSGWTPDFTLKGLQSLHRYELVARDDNTREWILKLNFSDFSFFNVLVYTKEELWYERAAIWLPGHSKYRAIEPLHKLKLQNSYLRGVNVDKWKLVKKIETVKGTRLYVDMPPSSARALERHDMLLSYELQKVSVFLKAVAVDKDTFDIGLKESSVNDENVIKTAIQNSPMPSLGADPNIVKISLKGKKSLNVDQARKIKERLIYHIFKSHLDKKSRKTDFTKYGFCLPGSFGVLPANNESKRWLETLDLGKLYKHAIVVLGTCDSNTKFIKVTVMVKKDRVINHAAILERLKTSNQGVKGLNFHLWKFLRYFKTDSKVGLNIEMDVESVDTLSKLKYNLDYIDENNSQHTAVVKYDRSYAKLEELVLKYKSELSDSYDVANMELESDPDDDIVFMGEIKNN